MRGSPPVIEALNRLLTLELTVINQYFLHSRMCENWGYGRLAQSIRETALEEMKDAEEYMDRILFLEGLPNMQRLETLRVGETVPEQLQIHLAAEKMVISALIDGVAIAEQEGDGATREFLADRLEEEERHVDWLETQLGLIDKLGEANYLTEQVRD